MKSRKGLSWLLVLLVAVCVPAVASTTMVTVSINEDALYTNAREVRLNLVYTGNHVPTEMRVCPSTAEGRWSEWFDYSNGMNWVLPGDDGLKTVKVETRYWIESRTDETVYGGWRVVTGEDDIFLDLTPPVLTVSAPDANENGWYNEPVAIVFQVNDAGSGLAASPDDVTLDQEGAGQSVVGKAVDKAGNETEVAVRDINIDLTPPVLAVSMKPSANENGWYNSPVSVVFQANDPGSGLATSPDNVTLDQEGAGQSVAGKAVDKAGNETTVMVRDINIDLTPPVLTMSVPDPNENGWYNEPVSVDYTAIDTLSGVASAPEDETFGMSSKVVLARRATDNAGNQVVLSDVLRVDVDAPSIVVDDVDPGASPDVWIPGPVTIAFLGSDRDSGVAPVEYVEGAEVVATEGAEQTVTAQVTDLAGNMSSEITVSHINIDDTLPTTTVLLADTEGTSSANTREAAFEAIDLKAKLNAFGTYDSANVALGYSFKDASGAPMAGLNAYASVLEIGAPGVAPGIQFFIFCEFAPTGGFYYFVLPAELVPGQLYEIWFEEIGGVHLFKTRVIAP